MESGGRSSSRGPVLPEADQQILRDLMSDAMEEIDVHQATSSVKPQSMVRQTGTFLWKLDVVDEAHIICILTNSSVSNLLKKRQV